MAKRPGPKSKTQKSKAEPKPKKVVEEEVEKEEEDVAKEEEPQDSGAENGNSEDNVESDSEEPPAKKGRGRGGKAAAKKKTPAKKSDRSSSRGRKAPQKIQPKKKKDEEEDEEEDDTEYEVETILDDGKIDGEVHYLVKWKGYAKKDATWEPISNLDCQDTIDAYLAKKEETKKAGPRSMRENPKKTDRLVDVTAPSGGKRHSRRGGKSPRKNYREEDSD